MTFGQGKSESLNTQASSAAPTVLPENKCQPWGFSSRTAANAPRSGHGFRSPRGCTLRNHSLSPLSLPLPVLPLKLATEGHSCLDDACSGKKKFTAVHWALSLFTHSRISLETRASGFSAPAHPSRKTGLLQVRSAPEFETASPRP